MAIATMTAAATAAATDRLTAQDIARLQSSRMRLLVTTGHPDMSRFAHPALGRLIQPRHTSSIEATDAAGIAWAADNDCFQGLDAIAWDKMLTRIKGLDGCLWATVPDKVADAVETARMFERWAPALERRGIPVALVAQDGLEELPEWLWRTWHRIDALFIGGSTEWKLGPAARALTREAQERGKWVHVGRVNTLRRLDYCRDVLAADSVDGSKWAKFKDTYLADGLDYCGRARNLTMAID
jgi:hypothetical protein